MLLQYLLLPIKPILPNYSMTVLDYMSGKARAALEGEKLKQGERKLKLLEEAAERASKTEAVLDSNLSSDDQAKRIREIFKR